MTDGKIIEADDIGNHYGQVAVREDGGKCFMSVENYDGWDWREISRTLFDAFVAEFSEPESAATEPEAEAD